MSKKHGFTLSETLITVVILGVVAALTVPALVRQQTLKANRVKIKKAFANYETAVNKMIIENNLGRSTTALNNYVKNDENCSNAYKYFKAVEKDGCRFMTSDKLWWDVGEKGSMSKTMVAFKKEDLTVPNGTSNTNYKAFYFSTDFDNKGSLRVMDLNYGYSVGDLLHVLFTSKVLAYLEGKETTDLLKYCKDSNSSNCYNQQYNTIHGNGSTVNNPKVWEQFVNCGNNCFSYRKYKNYVDENGRKVRVFNTCDQNSNCTKTEFMYNLSWDNVTSAQKEAIENAVRKKYGNDAQIIYSYMGGPRITYNANKVVNDYNDATLNHIEVNVNGTLRDFYPSDIENFDQYDW